MVDQDKQHTSWLTLISCWIETSSTVAAVSGCQNTEQINAGKNNQSIPPYIHGFWSLLWTLCHRVSLSSQLCINQLKKKKTLDVELSIFLMGFGKERRGVSTSDAHLGDVRVHMCITASDLCCTEHVSRHWFSQELELTPSPSAHKQTHICILSRGNGHQQEMHELNPSQVFRFLVKITHSYCWV